MRYEQASDLAGRAKHKHRPASRWATYVDLSTSSDNISHNTENMPVQEERALRCEPLNRTRGGGRWLKEVSVNGQPGFVRITPPPDSLLAASMRNGRTRTTLVGMPGEDGGVFEMRCSARSSLCSRCFHCLRTSSPFMTNLFTNADVALYHHSGEALQGLHFFEGGRVLSRKTCCQGVSRMPPIVTWGRHLPARGELAGERRVMRWAVHVKRQTGRWFFGFVRPPLSRDYGLVLDVASDGSVSI